MTGRRGVGGICAARRGSVEERKKTTEKSVANRKKDGEEERERS